MESFAHVSANTNNVSLDNLQDFTETKCGEDTVRTVDLTQLAVRLRHQGRPLQLVLDVNGCLTRLYGGYFSDFTCGGQWAKVIEYLTCLVRACHSSGLEVVAFFDGTLDGLHFGDRCRQRVQECCRVKDINRHINHKATPPPKLWWVAPVFLPIAIRLAFIQLGVAMAASVKDHRLEIVDYCRDNNFQGVIGHNADYLIFGVPRYFAGQNLKLKFDGSIVTDEYLINGLAQRLDINSKRICVFAALLGTHLLPLEDLVEFYCHLCSLSTPVQVFKLPFETRVAQVAHFVRGLVSVEDLNFVAKQVFKFCTVVGDRVDRFKQVVRYYFSGTADGFLHRCNNGFAYNVSPQPSGVYQNDIQTSKLSVGKPVHKKPENDGQIMPGDLRKTNHSSAPVDPSSLESGSGDQSSDTSTVDISLLFSAASQTNASAVISTAASRSGTLNPPPGVVQSTTLSDSEFDICRAPVYNVTNSFMSAPPKTCLKSTVSDSSGFTKSSSWKEFEQTLASEFGTSFQPQCHKQQSSVDDFTALVRRCEEVLHLHDYGSSSSGYASCVPMAAWDYGCSEPFGKQRWQNDSPSVMSYPGSVEKWWTVSPEIVAIAHSRLQRAIMCPWIYQLLTQGEIELPVLLGNPKEAELPTAIELYRPVRQRVYAVIFNVTKAAAFTLHGPHKRVIREWMVSMSDMDNSKPCWDDVPVEPLVWETPTLHQLWLGKSAPDGSVRMTVFLRFLGFDDNIEHLLLNKEYVPPEYFVMCCILRLLLAYDKQPVLQFNELEVFLATAVSLKFYSADDLQQFQPPILTVRGVTLAALFMHGIEHAVFVNDVAGSPLPLNFFCPWLFFDGRLFQYKFRQASSGSLSLHELCDNSAELTISVEKMRQAILQGVPKPSPFAFSRHPSSIQPSSVVPLSDIVFRPPDMSLCPTSTRGRGAMGMRMDRFGGALEVAGVIVGSWGANDEDTDNFVRVVDHRTALPEPRAFMRTSKRTRGKSAANRTASRGGGSDFLGTQVVWGRGRGHSKERGNSQPCRSTKSVPAVNFYNTNPIRKKPHCPDLLTPDLLSMTYEERTRVSLNDRGRGCTIELSDDERPGLVSANEDSI